MQPTTSNLEFKFNVNLRLVKPDLMQSTAVNLEIKLKFIFKLMPFTLWCTVSVVKLVSVAELVGLSLIKLVITKTVFFATRPNI